MKPSILFVDQFSDLGGSQRSMLDLLPALADFELEFALPGPGPLTAALQRRGLNWQQLEIGEYRLGRKSFADVARFAVRQPGAARRLSVDLIKSPMASRILPEAKRALGSSGS